MSWMVLTEPLPDRYMFLNVEVGCKIYGLVEEVQGYLRLSEAEVGDSRRVSGLPMGEENLLDDSDILDAHSYRRLDTFCPELGPFTFRLHSGIKF